MQVQSLCTVCESWVTGKKFSEDLELEDLFNFLLWFYELFMRKACSVGNGGGGNISSMGYKIYHEFLPYSVKANDL